MGKFSDFFNCLGFHEKKKKKKLIYSVAKDELEQMLNHKGISFLYIYIDIYIKYIIVIYIYIYKFIYCLLLYIKIFLKNLILKIL